MSLFLSLLLIFNLGWAEEAPEAEYPYPKTKGKVDEDYPEGVTKPKHKDRGGKFYYETGEEGKVYKHQGVESPESVGSDGTYYYGTGKDVKDHSPPGTEKPENIDSSGAYEYSTDRKEKDYTPDGVARPETVKSDGTYRYKKEDTTYDKALYLRVGLQGPYQWKSATNPNITYEDVYSDKPEFILNVDYEWKLFDSLGSFLFKFGSGLSFSQGIGRFRNTTTTDVPKETFQLVIFPNTATLTYKFEGAGGQLFVPFIDFGAGYFTFIEQRSDNENTRFGGALVGLGSVGMMLNLESMGMGVDADDGYNRSWFVLMFRQHLGLDERKDFTSSSLTLGIAVGW